MSTFGSYSTKARDNRTHAHFIHGQISTWRNCHVPHTSWEKPSLHPLANVTNPELFPTECHTE